MIDVIVIGGRFYSDYEKLKSVLNLFDIGLLIHGGDSLAERYAKEHYIESKPFPAKWGRHGKSAGPIRNREMLANYPNAVVIAFPGGRDTANCVAEAKARKHLVLEVK